MACSEQCKGCFSFFAVGEASVSASAEVGISSRNRCSLTDFPLDVLSNRLLVALPASSLVNLATTCQLFFTQIDTRPQLWESLARDLLGPASCALHEACAISNLPQGAPDVRWWRKLILAVTTGSALYWDASTSSRICGDVEAQSLLRCCAHASVSIGELVLLIGGKRLGRHPDSKVVVVNCRTCAVHAASLSADSVTPPALLRHAACAIASEKDGPPRALVVGGVVEYGFNPHFLYAGNALVLELLSDGGSSGKAPVVRWSWMPLSGDGPGSSRGSNDETPLFHHVLCSFDNGRRVLAWGGDTLDFNDGAGQAIAKVECIARSNFIFVLDVQSWAWSRISASGVGPGHRSLAMGFVHRSRLIVVGGSSDPKPPRAYEVGELAEMRPHALDLHTWTWLEPVTSGIDPPEPRTRFAADVCGDWLLGIGGRGMYNENLDDVFQLNLRTLNWVSPHVVNPEASTDVEACASSMGGNLVLGGIAMGIPFAKADALVFHIGT